MRVVDEDRLEREESGDGESDEPRPRLCSCDVTDVAVLRRLRLGKLRSRTSLEEEEEVGGDGVISSLVLDDEVEERGDEDADDLIQLDTLAC